MAQEISRVSLVKTIIRMTEYLNLIGKGYNDTVTLGNMTVHDQFIGVENRPLGITGFDGILGFVVIPSAFDRKLRTDGSQ